MALKLEYEKNAYGQTLNYPNAYVEVTNIVGDKLALTFTANIYNDESKAFAVDAANYRFNPDVSTNALNYHTQAYNFLKSLNMFVNSIDC